MLTAKRFFRFLLFTFIALFVFRFCEMCTPRLLLELQTCGFSSFQIRLGNPVKPVMSLKPQSSPLFAVLASFSFFAAAVFTVIPITCEV